MKKNKKKVCKKRKKIRNGLFDKPKKRKKTFIGRFFS